MTAQMTAEEKKSTVRRYYDEIWSQGKLSLVDELFAAGYRNIDPATPGVCLEGREAFKQLVVGFRTAFPDLVLKIEEQHCDGDVVVSRWAASGTHEGPLMGLPPTGRKGKQIMGVTITRFEGNRIKEDTAVWDTLGLLRQLGAAPAA